jgi:hypothetical protein
MSGEIRFSVSPPKGDRIHYVTEDDVRVVLSRLPEELYERLRAVHFNDRGWRRRFLGYVNRGRKEIALCALPPRMSLSRFLRNGESPATYGAQRGKQWPELAIRRFMLYKTFLHELGHLQVIRDHAKSERRKFAMETRAEQFAQFWRKKLWAAPFIHPDPVHNPPTEQETGES